MSRIIKNFDELATTPQRQDALAIVEAGLHAIDTRTVLEDSVILKGDILTIQGQQFDLTDYEHIYIIGFGKVACTAAHTLEHILAGRVRSGAVIGIAEKVCQVVDTYAGTHPLPSQLNYTATKHIEEVARSAKENDLVLVIVSGGGSALLCSSMSECDQGKRLFGTFLQSGGTVEELNVVRKHISHLKGGGLAKALYPATVASLVFSDVPGGDMVAVASGPTCLDTTTVIDAQAIIDQYNLGDFLLTETPKDAQYFKRVHNFTIVSNVTALVAMQQTAQELGYRAQLVSATQYATAQETISLLTEDADPGTVQCLGGETKIVVPDDCIGKGGRNDYLALSMLESLKEGQVFVSFASDGHDNTEAAGAIADTALLDNAVAANLHVAEFARCLNSFPFFEAVGGHIITGMLESNVSDLMFLLTPKPAIEAVSIDDISVQVIKDSRGKPTIEVSVVAGAHSGTFSVPSGASTGAREVRVVPPKEAHRIISEEVLPALKGVTVTDQLGIDARLRALGKTPSLECIGGNVALGVSVAACKAAASVKGVAVWEYIAELFGYQEQAAAPRLFVNLINGGQHAIVGSEIQEHQIIPDTDDVVLGLEAARAVQAALKDVLLEKYNPKDITIGDEGGYVVPSTTLEEPFSYLVEAITAAQTDVPIYIGADMAANSFFADGVYTLAGKQYSPHELLVRYHQLHADFPALQMVEDPCAEDDFSAFAQYHAAQPKVLTIGDDLTTTNKAVLKQAIATGAINGIIIKPNQIGTLSDTLATMHVAYTHNIKCIVSHRSGETMDDFIADLAYGTKCYGLKAGAPTMPERAVKYTRLLHIQST
jgi:phosphopyruvate hydratase